LPDRAPSLPSRPVVEQGHPLLEDSVESRKYAPVDLPPKALSIPQSYCQLFSAAVFDPILAPLLVENQHAGWIFLGRKEDLHEAPSNVDR